MKNFLVKNKYILIGLFASIIVRYTWVSNIGILTGGDWSYQNIEHLRQYFDYLSIWRFTDYGGVNSTPFTLPILYFMGFMAKTGLGFEFSERVFFLFPIIILSPISIYLISKEFNIKNNGIIVAILYFCFNTFYLISSNGALTLAVAQLLCVIALYFYIRSLRTLKYVDILCTTLIAFVCGLYDFRYVYILLWLQFIYLFFNVIYKRTKKIVIEYTKLNSIYLLLTILLNIFWVLPTLKSSNIVNNEAISNKLFGNEFLNLLYSIANYHPFWSGEEITPFYVNSIPLLYWSIPLLIFISITLIHKNFKNNYLIFVTLIGVTLVKQSGQPFEYIYQWLFEYLPGFNTFREASKFFLLTNLGYSLILGLIFTLQNNKFTKYLKHFTFIIVIILTLTNVQPILTQRLYGLEKVKSIPSEYQSFATKMRNDDQFGRVLWIPKASVWGYHDTNHPKVHFSKLYNSYSKEAGIDLGNNEDASSFKMLEVLRSDLFQYMIDMLSIKYLVVPTLDIDKDKDLFADSQQFEFSSKELRQQYIDVLKSKSNLELNIIKDLYVFKNNSFNDKITISNTTKNILGEYTLSDLNKNLSIINTSDLYKQTKDSDNIITLPFSNNEVNENGEYIYKNTNKLNNLKIVNFPAIELTRTKDNISISQTTLANYLYLDGKKIRNDKKTIFQSKYTDTLNLSLVLNGINYPLNKYNNLFFIDNKDTIDIAIEDNGKIEFESKIINDEIINQKSDFSELSYKSSSFKNINIIENGTFDKELWSKNVEDCHNYDNYPKISMELSNKALKLSAQRHIACTTKQVKVTPKGLYKFKFNYKTLKDKPVSYIISFNNSDKLVKDVFNAPKDGWGKFEKTFEVPNNSDLIDIKLLGFSDANYKQLDTYYDNVELYSIPNITNKVVLSNDLKVQNSYTYSYTQLNPTQYNLDVSTTNDEPFDIILSEQYNPNWHLLYKKDKSDVSIGAGKYSSIINGWLLDTKVVCNADSTNCKKNDKGGYDLKLSLEFTPQRWFNIGLVISGTTFIAMLAIIGVSFYRDRKNKVKKGKGSDLNPNEKLIQRLGPILLENKTTDKPSPNKMHKMF